MNPKISVIVIGCNIQDYVENCIESIRVQSFSDFETIFVDDGSCDATLSIVSKYRDSVHILQKPNGGIVSARKMGLRAAKGEYVAFVDGDDWLNVDFLKNLYGAVQEHPGVDIVGSDYFEESPNGIFAKRKCTIGTLSCRDMEFFDGILDNTIDHHMFPKLYRKEFVLRAGYLDYPEVSMAEDLLTNAFFGLFCPDVVFMDTPNYFYRYNPNGMMWRQGKSHLEQIKTMNLMEAFFTEHSDRDYHKGYDYQWFLYLRSYLFWNTESEIKRTIARAFRKKKIHVSQNEFCVKELRQMPMRKKVRLWTETYLPFSIPAVDAYCSMRHRVEKKRKGRASSLSRG